jgi:STE24 endopeptidase
MMTVPARRTTRAATALAFAFAAAGTLQVAAAPPAVSPAAPPRNSPSSSPANPGGASAAAAIVSPAESLSASAPAAVSPATISPAPPSTAGSPAAVSPASPPAGAARFDPVAATETYLASVPAEKKARSDAYFEGGYWLQLWGFLYGLAVAWLLLASGLSSAMRTRAERMAARIHMRWLGTFLYGAQFFVLTALLSFPLTVYSEYFREHKYGLATQGFAAWSLDQGKGLLVAVILGGLGLSLVYAVVRRTPRTWWLWGAVVATAFSTFGILVSPVFIEPLFNKYTELKDESVRGPILSLARANGIATEHVYVVDASKQTTRVSANVSGLAGTMRIALNDNLLRRASPAALQMVMGHEMGHYVLHHVEKSLLYALVVLVAGFAFLRWGFDRAVRRWGILWGVQGIGDTAGLPLLVALFSIFFFVLTPINNSFVRVQEAEADLFGLNASHQPDGQAEAALMLAEYRKMSPGPVEEWIFYDHPSGRNRIWTAMRWKAEHLRDLACVNAAPGASPAAAARQNTARAGAAPAPVPK